MYPIAISSRLESTTIQFIFHMGVPYSKGLSGSRAVLPCASASLSKPRRKPSYSSVQPIVASPVAPPPWNFTFHECCTPLCSYVH